MMKLTIPELRIIVDALEFKLAHFQEEQAKLDDSEQDKIAEFSNDMYDLELLADRLKDEYAERVQYIENTYQEYFHELSKAEATVFVGEEAETYLNIKKK